MASATECLAGLAGAPRSRRAGQDLQHWACLVGLQSRGHRFRGPRPAGPRARARWGPAVQVFKLPRQEAHHSHNGRSTAAAEHRLRPNPHPKKPSLTTLGRSWRLVSHVSGMESLAYDNDTRRSADEIPDCVRCATTRHEANQLRGGRCGAGFHSFVWRH